MQVDGILRWSCRDTTLPVCVCAVCVYPVVEQEAFDWLRPSHELGVKLTIMRTVSFSHSLSAVGSQSSNAIACTVHAHEPRRTRCVELAMYKSSLSMRRRQGRTRSASTESASLSQSVGKSQSIRSSGSDNRGAELGGR
jgi:hypothetical protein